MENVALLKNVYGDASFLLASRTVCIDNLPAVNFEKNLYLLFVVVVFVVVVVVKAAPLSVLLGVA